jgi:hypothetical protein
MFQLFRLTASPAEACDRPSTSEGAMPPPWSRPTSPAQSVPPRTIHINSRDPALCRSHRRADRSGRALVFKETDCALYPSNLAVRGGFSRCRSSSPKPLPGDDQPPTWTVIAGAVPGNASNGLGSAHRRHRGRRIPRPARGDGSPALAVSRHNRNLALPYDIDVLTAGLGGRYRSGKSGIFRRLLAAVPQQRHCAEDGPHLEQNRLTAAASGTRRSSRSYFISAT